mgnify:CR=1 FL=1
MSALRRPLRARRAAPPEDVRRADASASTWTSLLHRQKMQIKRQEPLERSIERAHPRDDVRAGQRRMQIETRAQNLDEHAVGTRRRHSARQRAWTSRSPGSVRRLSCKLVQQPALAGARLRRRRQPPSRRQRQPGRRAPAALTTRIDGRRKASVPFASRLPTASRCRSRRGRGTASPAPPANRARRRRTPAMCMSGRRDAASPGSTHTSPGSARTARRQALRQRRRRCRSGAALRADDERRQVRRAAPTARAGDARPGARVDRSLHRRVR